MIQALLLVAAFAPQDSRPPDWVKFEIARERVGHKIVVEAALKNVSPVEIAVLKVTALFFDGERELKRSAPVSVPKLAPGATAPVKIEAEQVPNFSRYDLYVETAAATFLYHGTDAAKLPTLRPATGPRLVLASHVLSPLSLVVKNPGGAPADEPTATLTFKSTSGGIVHQTRLRLEKAVAAASEETFELSVPGAPPHATVDVALAWQASDEIVVADPVGGAGDLNLRQCRAVRLTDGSARVSGLLANATGGGVKKVSIRFQLGKRDVPYDPPDGLKPGESRPFVFYAPAVPAFDALGFSLSFEGGPAGPEAAAPPSARRTGSRRLEAERIALPPPPKTVQEAASTEARPPSVGIRGLLVVEGTYGKNGKYTGDIYLMRMIFLDEKGKAWQPEANVTFTLYDGEKNLKRAQREITRAGWAADAARVNNGQPADLDTIAFDRKTGELWVGIYWSDTAWKKPRADVTVEIKGAGTYTLKGVEGKWAFAPQWPDGK